MVVEIKMPQFSLKKDLSREEDNKLSAKVKSEFGDNPQINTVSPLIGQELAKKCCNCINTCFYRHYYLCFTKI